MKYTNEEVQRNIETLSNIVHLKKLERTVLTKYINETTKKIKEWKELHFSQLKAF